MFEVNQFLDDEFVSSLPSTPDNRSVPTTRQSSAVMSDEEDIEFGVYGQGEYVKKIRPARRASFSVPNAVPDKKLQHQTKAISHETGLSQLHMISETGRSFQPKSQGFSTLANAMLTDMSTTDELLPLNYNRRARSETNLSSVDTASMSSWSSLTGSTTSLSSVSTHSNNLSRFASSLSVSENSLAPHSLSPKALSTSNPNLVSSTGKIQTSSPDVSLLFSLFAVLEHPTESSSNSSPSSTTSTPSNGPSTHNITPTVSLGGISPDLSSSRKMRTARPARRRSNDKFSIPPPPQTDGYVPTTHESFASPPTLDAFAPTPPSVSIINSEDVLDDLPVGLESMAINNSSQLLQMLPSPITPVSNSFSSGLYSPCTLSPFPADRSENSTMLGDLVNNMN